MPAPTRANALDHVVVVLFENRSLDNVLGRLYGPGDGKAFEGVIGKELSNPIPGWAEHGADRKVVPYGVTTDMDSPNPDSGEEWYHTNTQLFGTIDDHNRFKIGEGVAAPWNAPPPGAVPAMDGFVADYISTFTGEVGRQPTYEEYAQIMTGYTPQQLPVLSGIAREFGVFDHWFSEVPSQTFMNRSFWTAATSSGLVVNAPVRKWFTDNDAVPSHERYNYLYSPAELGPWATRIEKIAERSREVYVITNNHYQGKAVVNALELISILKHTKVKVPEPLRQHFPQLDKIADTPPAEPSLFPLGRREE